MLRNTLVDTTLFTERSHGGPVDWDSQRIRRWRGMSARYCRSKGELEYEFTLARNAHRVVFLDLVRAAGEIVVERLAPIRTKELRDKLLFAPAGCQVQGWAHLFKPASLIVLELDPDVFGGLSELPPLFGSVDPMMRSILLQYRSILLDEPGYDDSYIQALGHILSVELGRAAKREVKENPSAGLTSLQLRKAIAYIDDRLDQSLSVSDVASQLNMSQFHFTRMFRQAMGVPPHKFCVLRRVERAKELLGTEGLTVAEVAERTGFGSATQLSRTFRKVLGVSPTSYRRGEC